MYEPCSLADIDEQIDALLEMMRDHEDSLIGVMDLIQEAQDEIKHLISQDNDQEE